MASNKSSGEILREIQRENIRIIRRENKEKLLDALRGLLEENISLENVRELAIAVRRRGACDLKSLVTLQHALLRGPQYISAFMSTDGALFGLIKKMTGLEPSLAVRAAYCMCNLTLTTENKTCVKITKSASTYLLIHLEGSNTYLQDACVWALGNLCAGSQEAWMMLYSKGILGKILQLLKSQNEEVVTSAIYALTHFVSTGLNSLKDEELNDIVKIICPMVRKYSLGYLIFIFSTKECCDKNLCEAVNPVTEKMSEMIPWTEENISEFTFCLRFIGNISVNYNGGLLAIQGLMKYNKIISYSFAASPLEQSLCNSSHIRQEFFWVLSNFYTHNNHQVTALFQHLLCFL